MLLMLMLILCPFRGLAIESSICSFQPMPQPQGRRDAWLDGNASGNPKNQRSTTPTTQNKLPREFELRQVRCTALGF